MKRFFCFFALLTGLSLPLLQAQDLSGFTLLAHYPLTDSAAADVTGNYNPMQLTQTEFQGAEGIYANGIYIYSGDPNGSLISTPPIDFPDSAHFAFSLEFKAAATDFRPIFVAGDAYRWLGAFVSNGSLQLLINDILYETGTSIQTGQWYQLTLTYREGDTQLYLNDQMTLQKQVDSLLYSLEAPDQHKISNTHFGYGTALQGHWRNLKIYGKDNSLSSSEKPLPQPLSFYPNPTAGPLFIGFPPDFQPHGPVKLRLMDEYGGIHQEKKTSSGQILLDLSPLPPGLYILHLSDSSGQVWAGKVLVNKAW